MSSTLKHPVYTCVIPDVSTLMSNPLPIPAPIELIILSIWTNGKREKESENQSKKDVQHVQEKAISQ